MKDILIVGTRIEDLLLRIEQIIDKRLESLAPQQQDQSDYLTRKEAAGILKITLPTLHDWTKQGWLQSYKLGNRVLYKKQEVENSIQQVNFFKHKKGGLR
jgi:excisionase family DNA binding protein